MLQARTLRCEILLCLLLTFESIHSISDSNNSLDISATTLCLVLNAIFVYSVQPCRSITHNRIDSLVMGMLAFCCVSILTMLTTFYLDSYWLVPSNISFGVCQFVIFIFFTIVFGWTLLRHKLRKLYSKLFHSTSERIMTRWLMLSEKTFCKVSLKGVP